MQEMTLNGKLLEKRCGLISGKEEQSNEENIDCVNYGYIRSNTNPGNGRKCYTCLLYTSDAADEL